METRLRLIERCARLLALFERALRAADVQSNH